MVYYIKTLTSHIPSGQLARQHLGAGAERLTEIKLWILPIRLLPRKESTPPHRPNRKGFMTKDYNQQRRGDVRPSSRNQSSSRHGEERSSRAARPRLNRETVDRAWESGAPRYHADYRVRNNNGQPPRDNRRRNQDAPSAQHGRKPYGNQQGHYQRSERTPNDDHNPRSRSFDSRTRNFDDRRSSDRRNYSDRSGGPGSRSQSGAEFRDREQYRDRGSPFRDRDRNNQSRGYERRGFDHDNRSPRTFDRGNRSPRNFQQANTQNPRWRSRPMAQNDNQPGGRQDFGRREHFEGDYEHLETPGRHGPANRSYQHHADQENEGRHVTRLPDGRVLKGPRPVQRKNAEFWTEVSDDAKALVEPVEASVPVKEAPTENNEPIVTDRPRTRTKGTAARTRKPGAKQRTTKPRSTGPKPSQRGFKWPTP